MLLQLFISWLNLFLEEKRFLFVEASFQVWTSKLYCLLVCCEQVNWLAFQNWLTFNVILYCYYFTLFSSLTFLNHWIIFSDCREVGASPNWTWRFVRYVGRSQDRTGPSLRLARVPKRRQTDWHPHEYTGGTVQLFICDNLDFTLQQPVPNRIA